MALGNDSTAQYLGLVRLEWLDTRGAESWYTDSSFTKLALADSWNGLLASSLHEQYILGIVAVAFC